MPLVVYFLFVIIYGGANGYASLFDPTSFIGLIHILFLVTILELCFFFAGSLQRRRKNVTRKFRSGASVLKKPTREPAAMRTIKPGKIGVTSITVDGETSCCSLV